MGAGQSNTNGGKQSTQSDVKTSYYELLGIERNATEDQIKKAYRKKALELHPDRNYGNVEATTKLFAEVQSAHEVLSDPQERAWYDSHESAILRGDDVDAQDANYDANVKFSSADDITRLVRRFNSNVDFTDAPSGFFGYLKETFDQIAREEEAAAYIDGGGIPEYPSFGHSADDYEDVVKPFYAVWLSFATKKSFAWKDQYRLSEAPDRRYRRAMEKENQRLRDDGIKEFNDAVRSLIAFIRKRDPRYVPTQQSEAERQKILRDATAAQAARDRAANAAKMDQEVPEWAKIVQKDDLEGEIPDSSSEEEQIECVACRKTFKSEKQYESHEKSNKHKKAIQALRKKMQKENKHIILEDEDDISSGVATPEVVEDHDVKGDETVEKEPTEDEIDEVKMDDLSLEDDEVSRSTEERHDLDDDDLDDKEANELEKHEIPHEQSDNKDSDTAKDETDSDQDSDYASPETVKSRLDNDTPDTNATKAIDDDPEDKTQAQKPKMGKAAQKRARKAAATVSTESDDNKFKCTGCDASFPSKTRMHQHIKDFGHAALKPASGGGKSKKGRK